MNRDMIDLPLDLWLISKIRKARNPEAKRYWQGKLDELTRITLRR